MALALAVVAAEDQRVDSHFGLDHCARLESPAP
jgi:membrane peptidoglycan carboxypeptidase